MSITLVFSCGGQMYLCAPRLESGEGGHQAAPPSLLCLRDCLHPQQKLQRSASACGSWQRKYAIHSMLYSSKVMFDYDCKLLLTASEHPNIVKHRWYVWLPCTTSPPPTSSPCRWSVPGRTWRWRWRLTTRDTPSGPRWWSSSPPSYLSWRSLSSTSLLFARGEWVFLAVR